MQVRGRKVLLCDCEGTMCLDGKALGRALGTGEAPVHRHLCRTQIESFRRAAAGGEPLLVACTQEAPLFAEAAGEIEGAGLPVFANIREQAGWSAEGEAATPKIAALLAAAAVPVEPPMAVSMRSQGRCLVYGRGQEALDAATQLAGRLPVTLLLSAPGEALPPRIVAFPLFAGRARRLSGHLGAFRLEVEGLAAMRVSSRSTLEPETPAREPAPLEADLVLDLSGGPALVAAAGRRDGYLRAEPGDPAGIARALFAASDLVGEFEKPRYVTYKADLCAHSRSRRTGCTRCLDNCPTGAISSEGDIVRIDPWICAGCGACASVCPTGAATYAAPRPGLQLERLRALLGTYHSAGGGRAVLLVHEERHGGDLLSALARFGRGLPARVLPFAVAEIAQLGLDTLAGALAYGASEIVLLVPPAKRHETGGLEAAAGQLDAVARGLGFEGARVRLVEESDPDALEGMLWELAPLPPVPPARYLPMGGKRELMRLALDHLHEVAPAPASSVAMPEGAPFGAVHVDSDGCTLCLACVGACPTGALLDNPDRPMLRFTEDACVQCGLCRNTCPEKVITLEPRLSFAPEAREPRLLKEEEPCGCVRCGKPFGTRSSVERIVARLADHPMFSEPGQIERLRMCEDCRVVAHMESGRDPLRLGERRIVRTTDDYLREREAVQPPAGTRRH
ncbi:4Fe-4S dicluster domain-containing protein [Geminicoccaceae bacterium 1502E]|nr:4Fe-4S dicluster domain-containing protein [Geminicoccaceae bacterium 1502E]